MYRKKNLDMTLYRGLSTDTKPDADFGSVFHEMDTGDVYRTDGDEWHQCGSLIGSDPSIYMSRWVRGNTKKAWELSALAGNAGGGELPDGYRRIKGIRFDGDFHYRTGEALIGDDDVTMTLDNTASSGKNVFGSYNGSNSKNFSLYIYGGGSTSGTYFRYGNQLKRPIFGDGKRTITFGRSGTQGFETDVDVTPDEFTTPANTYIGMLPNSSSPAYIGSIIGNILISNRLKYVPCERISDGKIGYYETIKGKFIEPYGTGTPEKES